MSAPIAPRDPLRRAVKEALALQAAEVASPPVDGLAAAVTAGARLRSLRRARWTAGALGVVVLLVAGGIWTLSGDDASGTDSATGSSVGDPTPHAPDRSSSPSSTVAPATPASPPDQSGWSEGGTHQGPTAVLGATSPGGADPGPVPTPTTSAPPPTTTTTTAPAELRLLVSLHDDRSDAFPLHGATLSGVVYIFWDHLLAPPTAGSVTFWIDDPDRLGPPHRVEHAVHYDLEATAPGGEAYGFDLSSLGPGPHSVTAEAGPGEVATATFTVL